MAYRAFIERIEPYVSGVLLALFAAGVLLFAVLTVYLAVTTP